MGKQVDGVLSNVNLDKVGRSKGIEKFIELHAGTPEVSPKTMATTVEAILGAVFKDSYDDLEAVKRAMVAFGLIKA